MALGTVGLPTPDSDVIWKADKSPYGQITIPTTGWQNDSSEHFPNYYDFDIAGLTINDRVDLNILPQSTDAAEEAIFGATETLSGKCRIRAVNVPTAAILAQYWVQQGSGSPSYSGTGSLSLKNLDPTADTLTSSDPADFIPIVDSSDDSKMKKILVSNLLQSDNPTATDITIPTSGWQSDSTADYPSYFDINVTGVTVKDRASVDIKRASRAAAAACGLAYNETLAGKIRLRAASAPTEAIQAQYWIEQGKE